MGPAIRGESGRGEVRDDVDVDFVAMLLRGETRVHDGDRASGAEATPAAGPWADYRLRLTLDQWTPDGAVSGEITDITRLRLRFRSDYGTVTALDGSAVPQTQDLFRPLLLAVHRDDGAGIDGSTADTSRVVISVVAERLDTPVRIPDTPDATGRRGMRFFADPELAYERGTFYLFATTDGHSEWSGWQIHCLASEDLTHWQDRGVVIDLHDQHLDGSGRTNILPAHAWVPVLAVRDGRYCLYFCGDGQANVAVSDHIDGGYALQGDLARTGSHAARHGFGTGIVAPGIDPAAFRDPQAGRWYLAWGQNRARYSRLSDDMLHIIPEATPDIREAAYLNVREHAGTWTYYRTRSATSTTPTIESPMRPRRPSKATVRSGPIAAKSWSPTNASAYSAPGITAYFGSPAPTNGSSSTTAFCRTPCARAAWTGTRVSASAPATSAKSGSPDSNSTNGTDGVPLIRPVTVSMSSLAWS